MKKRQIETIRRVMARGYAYLPDHDRTVSVDTAVAALRAGVLVASRQGTNYLEVVAV